MRCVMILVTPPQCPEIQCSLAHGNSLNHGCLSPWLAGLDLAIVRGDHQPHAVNVRDISSTAVQIGFLARQGGGLTCSSVRYSRTWARDVSDLKVP